MKVKEESEKVGLKLNIQKTNIMASGKINAWQINGETMEIVTDFIFEGLKITVDGDCSHEIKRRLLLERKAMINLDSILKSRDIPLLTKVYIVKAMVFPSGPITSWEIDGETVETVSDFIFLGSKITVDGDCRHEIKRRLLLGRKVMTNLDSIFKSRDITLPTKFRLVKAMVFPVVTYGCESQTVKKAECRRIDAFELWCWRRLLRVPWTARRSNQSMLKEITPEYSLEGLTLKLKRQYFGHLM